MKCKLLALVLSLLFSVEAGATIKLHNHHNFGDWRLYEGKEGNKKVCYAMVEPYRTRSFIGMREKPWVALTFFERNALTVSAHSGFNIDTKTELVLDIDNGSSISMHVLPTGQVYSYSSAQDVQIINALMQGESYFTIRSYGINQQTALDYYSLKGLHEIIKYMNKHCE